MGRGVADNGDLMNLTIEKRQDGGRDKSDAGATPATGDTKSKAGAGAGTKATADSSPVVDAKPTAGNAKSDPTPTPAEITKAAPSKEVQTSSADEPNDAPKVSSNYTFSTNY